MFAALAPIGRLLGYKPSYPEYGKPQSSEQERSTAFLIYGTELAVAGAAVLVAFTLRRRGGARGKNRRMVF